MRNVMVHIFSPSTGLSQCIGRAISGFTLGATLALAGCATAPPPNDSMNLAQSQLQAARDADAADYAPVDLGFAQDRFQRAQAAMAGRKYAVAAELAEESRADAELARAKARLGAARAQIQNKVQENTQLRTQGEAAAVNQSSRQDADGSAPAAPSAEDMPADMPAPSASVLSAPPAADGGFQTVPAGHPDSDQQPSTTPQGGQP
jgi:hypothetical protein